MTGAGNVTREEARPMKKYAFKFHYNAHDGQTASPYCGISSITVETKEKLESLLDVFTSHGVNIESKERKKGMYIPGGRILRIDWEEC